MAAGKFLLCILCAAGIGRGWMFDGNLLKTQRGDVVEIALKEVGVREATGNNDGARVEQYLASVGLHRGAPWCAAFISWVFKQAGYSAPRTAWSPDLFPAKRRVTSAMPGVVFGIYFARLGRIGHCGIVESTRHDWVETIEGNTSGGGARDGDGVYRRCRHKRSISKFADWR